MIYAIEWRRQRILGALTESERRALVQSRWARWALGVAVAGMAALVIAALVTV